METITIIERHECLPFSELDSNVQEKAMREYGDWHVNTYWWGGIYDQFVERCKDEYGIDVDLSGTYFSGFYSQGDGAAFAGRLTAIDKFLERTNCPVEFRRVLRYMFNETGLRLTACRSNERYINQSCDIDRYDGNPHDNEDNQQDHYEHAEKALDWLEAAWEGACTDLASELYRSLEQEYDYLTGIEALSETFNANECVFDIETGEMFHIQDAQQVA